MLDPWATPRPTLRLSCEHLPEGDWQVRAETISGVTHRLLHAHSAQFCGLDAALGWLEAEAFRHGLATGVPITYVSALDPEDAPTRAQQGLPF